MVHATVFFLVFCFSFFGVCGVGWGVVVAFFYTGTLWKYAVLKVTRKCTRAHTPTRTHEHTAGWSVLVLTITKWSHQSVFVVWVLILFFMHLLKIFKYWSMWTGSNLNFLNRPRHSSFIVLSSFGFLSPLALLLALQQNVKYTGYWALQIRQDLTLTGPI